MLCLSISTPGFPHFYYILGENLGLLWQVDVSMMNSLGLLWQVDVSMMNSFWFISLFPFTEIHVFNAIIADKFYPKNVIFKPRQWQCPGAFI